MVSMRARRSEQRPRLGWYAALVLVCAACSKPQATPRSSASSSTVVDTSTTAAPINIVDRGLQEQPSPSSRPSSPDCVSACMRQNMMRAVAPEDIRADCEKSCRTDTASGS